MFIALAILAALTGVGIWLTERVDRPARRSERQARG